MKPRANVPERHAMAGNHARVTTAAFSYTTQQQCKGIWKFLPVESGIQEKNS